MSLSKSIGLAMREFLGGSSLLVSLERRFLQHQIAIGQPPIFLVGSPRTGSTLLYQLIVRYYDTAYFSNFTSVFYGAPSISTWATAPFSKRHRESGFRSKYGVINGLWAPSEAGAIQNNWFSTDDGNYISSEVIQKTCSSISKNMGGTFVWKNLNNSFVLAELQSAFPSALFVKIQRDLAFTCQSIYITVAKARTGNIKGLRFADLQDGENIIETIVTKVLEIERKTNAFFSESGCNSLKINYEVLCQDYSRELAKIEEAYSCSGDMLKQKRNFDSLRLTPSEQVKVSRGEWRAINAALSKHDIVVRCA